MRHRTAIVLAAMIGLSSGAHAVVVADQCSNPPGDIGGDGTATVVDVQCAILGALWQLDSGVPAEAPECAPLVAWLDLNCDAVVDISDVIVCTQNILGVPLASEIDANEDACPDDCQSFCGDGFCDPAPGEWCESCPEDCACPAVFDAVYPPILGVEGRANVELYGEGVSDAVEVYVDGIQAIVEDPPWFVTDLWITAPPHPVGWADVLLVDADGVETLYEDALHYAAAHSPFIDGELDAESSEWPSTLLVATNDVPTNANLLGIEYSLDTLAASFDEQNLYVAIEGTLQPGSFLSYPVGVLVYVDVDFGAGTGPTSLAGVGGPSGSLPQAMDSAVWVDVPGFGVDFVGGTVDQASADWLGSEVAVSDAGWRAVGSGGGVEWVDGAVATDPHLIEMAIPLGDLISLPVAEEGVTMALFVRVVDVDGTYAANQALPPVDLTDVWRQTAVAVIDVFPLSGGINKSRCYRAYVDGDADTHRGTTAKHWTCVPTHGFTADDLVSDGLDCDDADPEVGPPQMHYWDEDQDGYSDDSTQIHGWYCPGETTANWTLELGDCCEGDDRVHPGQTQYFVNPYSCQGQVEPTYDYDCDGEETKRWDQEVVCDPNQGCAVIEPGLSGPISSECGKYNGTSVVQACSYDPFGDGCIPSQTAGLKQQCR